MSQTVGRRQVLIGGAAAGLAGARPRAALAQDSRFSVKVASNQGVENAPLQQLMLDRGYLGALSVDADLVESSTVSGPMEALLSDQADICMISAFVGVLPAIAQGKPLRLVGAAMLLPALAVYTGKSDIRKARDLVGRTVGVGPKNGLLHLTLLALLRKTGVDPAKVDFVNTGSSAQTFQAVIAGKVDAGVSGVAGLSDPAARVLEDGRLWEQLPDYTYQPAYASVRAIREKPEALARCMAAYGRLYRYLSGPDSEAAYLDARRRATREADPAEGEAVWHFIRRYQPYDLDLGLTPRRIAYLQDLNVAAGLQPAVLPFDRVADMSIATRARQLLG